MRIIRLEPFHQNNQKQQRGFALIEILVAVTILSLIGLMAWRGMDAMIRGHQIIEQRSDADSGYLQLVKQFDKDCSEIPSEDQLGFSPINYSSQDLWLLRRAILNGRSTWMLVGYTTGPDGLKRELISDIEELSEVKKFLKSVDKKNFNNPASDISFKLAEVSQQLISLVPDQKGPSQSLSRGIQVQWVIANANYPITSSCLIGQGV